MVINNSVNSTISATSDIEKLLHYKKKSLDASITRHQKIKLNVDEAFKRVEKSERENKILYFSHPDKGYLGANGKWDFNPTQRKVFAAMDDPAYKILTMSGANRIGKTFTEFLLIFAYSMGCWPWELNDKSKAGSFWRRMGINKYPIKVRWGGQDWEKHVKTVIVAAMKELWPKIIPIDYKKNNVGVEYFWTIPSNGSTIEIMSNNQDSDVFEGWYGHLLCIEGSQKVLMGGRHWKPIKDINVGDKVWSVSDKGYKRCITEVTRHVCNGVKATYRLELTGGVRLRCTLDHKVFTKDGYKEVQHLTSKDKIYVPMVDELLISSSFPANRIWFNVGAWIGDGWSNENRIYISSANEEFLNHFNDCFPEEIKTKHKKRYDYVIEPQGKKNEFAILLKKIGLFGKKAYNKFIPDCIFTFNNKDKIEFIRGLYATDGWIHKATIGYASTSEILVRDLWKLLFSLGIYSTITFKKSQNKGKWRDQFFLSINKSDSVILFVDLIQFIPGKTENLLKARLKKIEILDKNKDRFGTFKDVRNKDSIKQRIRSKNQWFRFKSLSDPIEANVYDITVERTDLLAAKMSINRKESIGKNFHNFICEGVKVSNCWDEPPKRENRVASARGLVDTCGREFFGMTLLKEAWVSTDIIEATLPDGTPDLSVFNIDAKIGTNVGYGITQEGVDQFAKTLNADEKSARLDGVPSYKAGLVLPIDRNKHFIERFPIPKHWPIDIAIDIGLAKPHDVLYIATAENNMKYVIFEEEIAGPGETIADSIIRKKIRYGMRINRIIIDPLAKADKNNENTTYGKIDLALNRYEMYLETGSKDKDDAIISMKSLLNTVNGQSALFIFRDLKKTTRQVLNWMYDENGKPSKKDDDQCENLYRLILLGTQYDDDAFYGSDDDDIQGRVTHRSETVNTVCGY